MKPKRHSIQKGKKGEKKAKPDKSTRTGHVRKKVEPKKSPVIPKKELPRVLIVEPPVRERVVITAENIRGDTAIGDLLVTFPQTRQILASKGLRLEAEDAGDIYMTLDVFSAMNGLKTEGLLQDLVEVAKRPATPPLQAPLVEAPIL